MTAASVPGPRANARDLAGAAGDALLVRAAAFFVLAVLVHNGDHTRRGVDSVSRDVFWIGTSAIALEVAVVVLACARHRLAPMVLAAAGASLAIGYLGVHFSPERDLLSDSLLTSRAAGFSIFAASLEVAAALGLLVTGALVARARGGASASMADNPRSIPLRRAALHPLVLAIALGNVVVLAISFAQLAG